MNKLQQIIFVLENWIVIHPESPHVQQVEKVINSLRKLAQTQAGTAIAIAVLKLWALDEEVNTDRQGD